MKTITPRELDRLLSKTPDLALIDVRTPLEFAEVHVPQAILHPLDELTTATFPNKEAPVYILCRSGQRAAKAALLFSKEGFENTTVVEGGTLAWIEAGLPVERGTVKTINLERQVRIAAGSIVLTGVILARFVNPAFFVVPAFVGAGLIFAGISDWCGMGLLLARAPWNKRGAA